MVTLSFLTIQYSRFPVAARSKAWICGRSLAGIVGSNPAGDMDICLLCLLFVAKYRSLWRADHSSRGVLQIVVFLNTISKTRQGRGLDSRWLLNHEVKKYFSYLTTYFLMHIHIFSKMKWPFNFLRVWITATMLHMRTTTIILDWKAPWQPQNIL